jgi:hypothetical protein
MPTPEEILNGLAFAANKFIMLGIAWHIITFAFIILLLSGRKFNKKYIAAGSGILLLSVGYIANLVSNPFNAILFAIAALLFGIFTMKFKKVQVGLKWDYISVAGLIMFIFGFVYPHFLEGEPLYKYLYASPLGLIPCPTLSVFTGITLMLHGFQSKKWMITAAFLGLFYGIFGVLRLKVYLDIVLIAGALFLLVYAFTRKQSNEIIAE